MGKRVNRNELAEIFDVSLPTVSAWLRAGMPVLEQGRKGREYAFDTGEVRKWLEDRAVSATQGDMSKLSLEEIRKRYETARAAREELELAKAKREVVPIDEVSKIVGAEFSRCKTRLLAIPTKVRPTVEEWTGNPEATAEIVQAIEARIYEGLSEIVSHVGEEEEGEPGEGAAADDFPE
jgi:phage terminase Nu1 subunit (DNA packaging protein)